MFWRSVERNGNRWAPLARWARHFLPVLIVFLLAAALPSARASLQSYDAAITNDWRDGYAPAARLTTPAVISGASRAAFNFGNITGSATFEFIIEGDPALSPGAVCLAVGANASSVLRYEQWSNTGLLGFTQLGVADYLFNPAVPSPRGPLHLTYVWDAPARTMQVYLNGLQAGARSGVDAAFGMPSGAGYLGGDAANGDLLFGTYHRVTIYSAVLPDDVIRRHADIYNGLPSLPTIESFTATPAVLFTPAGATLSWIVRGAAAVLLDGAPVTGTTNVVVTPAATTTYTLTASNQDGVVSASATVVVNPAPEITSFRASRAFLPAGQATTLMWAAHYGQTLAIAPGVGDVAALTTNGAGAVVVQPTAPVTYTLTVASVFGSQTARVQINPAVPAAHLVISEFMADNEMTLRDEDNEFPGWIEIHNPTPQPVNLAGYHLTDDASNPVKWAFPATNLPAGGYLLVFASGKDRAQAGRPLHANFELNNGGEFLALAGPGPALVHGFTPEYPPQRGDIAYGLLSGDPALARFLGVPTPGAPNDETPPRPQPVQIAPASGTFADIVTVTLSAPEPGAEIRYTLDGSLPGLTHGNLYTGPLAITNTARLRAVAVVDGLASRARGAGYIRLAPDLLAYTSSLPIMVIENFRAGVIQQKGWNSTGAGIRQVPRQAAVWATFDRAPGGGSALTNAPQMASLVGIRGRGAYSSTWRQKPYSVEAIDEEGDEVKVAPLDLPAHADWVLYFPDPDSNKDPALLFNTFAYELSRNCGRYSVRFRWVEAFINEDGGPLSLADRRGVYAIMEKVARGADRLDFAPLASDGSTGSWLLNINRMDPEPESGWPAPNGATQPWYFHTAGRNRIVESAPNGQKGGDDEPMQSNGYLNFENPNGFTINSAQRAAIEGWFRQFENVLWNDALWRDPALGYRRYLDSVDFADYFILNVLSKNGDGLLISMFPWKGDDGKLRMGPGWDYNWSAYYIAGTATDALLHRSERLWYQRLFADPDFYQLYIDRWWEHRRGPMSDAALDAIVDGQMNDITPAKALLNGLPSEADWLARLAQFKTWLKQRANWIDSNYLRPPAFDHPGGAVPDGFPAVVRGTNGTIYFTLTGADPRAPGGGVAAGAQAYQAPIVLTASAMVSARVKNGTNWSGLTTAVYALPQDLSKLAITEIMYHPAPFGNWTAEDLEFVELKNNGTNLLNLGLLHFNEGISFAFTNGTMLAPGQFLVLARNAAAFAERYPGVAVNGVFAGRLDNGGETLRLATPAGATVLAVAYHDRAPWPLAADGHGFSLVPRDAATGNSDDGARWRASAQPGGSPGADDPVATLIPVVINEVLTHTDLPELDGIELFNPTAQYADLSGWFLSDDGTVPWKFQFPPGSIIPAQGYYWLSETNFNPGSGNWFDFALDGAGDSLYLGSGDGTNLTGYSHGISFGAAAAGMSFGRHVNSFGAEQFPAQIRVTPGGSNAGPRIGPLVISEIMYHPGANGDEFVEIQNLTGSEVPLFDPANPVNPWRISGLDFYFPTNLVLPAHSRLLVVAADPAGFRAKYGVPDAVPALGPFVGALQDSGERLELQRPDLPDTNGVPYITVDGVRYNDRAPWPPGADGGGPSLQRRNILAYGDDPMNWEAALATPGAAYLPGLPPTLVAQPTGRTVVAYQDLEFTVVAEGSAPLYFQWTFNRDPLPGATNATLRLTNVQPAQAGVYQAVVFNDAGADASAEIPLVVLLPAKILQQPLDVRTNAGQTARFSVSATGTGALSYQWRYNGGLLPDATHATLALTNVQPAQAGDYSVVITDAIGPVASRAARLTVLVRPTIVQAPLAQTLVAGGTAVFSLAITNAATFPVTNRWRINGQFFRTNVIAEPLDFLVVNPVLPGQSNVMVSAANAAGSASSPFIGFVVLPDGDGDGMPDAWETAYGFSTNSAADGLADADADGMANGQEFVAGTNPTNAQSYLAVTASLESAAAWIRFGAISNKTYTLEYRDGLAGGVWAALVEFPARPQNGVESFIDQGFATNRLYRVKTPARP